MTRRYLVAGGAGFIGSNFIRHLFEHEPEAQMTNVDALSVAGVAATVGELDTDDRHTFVHADIADAAAVASVIPGHDVVVNFAAESHVDRSIDDPAPFLRSNVVGAGVLLEAARQAGIGRFLQVSTDEVYGPQPAGAASEDAPLAPSSPYAASKAAADLLAHSYQVTFDYGAIVSRCTNNYGPYQFPEKVIPLFVTNLLAGDPVPLYGDGRHERDWLHVTDHCAALHLLVDAGAPGEVYNVGSGMTLSNADLTKRLLALVGRDESFVQHVPDRPGHDVRYALDCAKLHALGWSPEVDLDQGLADTVRWYRTRADWWRPLRFPEQPA